MSSDPTDPRDDRGGADSSPALSIHRPDVYVALVVWAICAFLFVNTFWFDSVPSSLAQNVQPTVFPRLVLITIALIALILPFEYHRKIRHGTDLDSDRREPLGRIVWVTGAVLVVLAMATQWLGALPALFLITATLPLLWGERRWKVLIPYVILFPLAVMYLFAELLQVNFPDGLLGGFLF
jgi:hypothetical protein